ncbi:MAG: hypothetical protein M3299_02595 [Thermoproteota archaeon]|nr:hypothetical protein [Thermoproteota archaeon]
MSNIRHRTTSPHTIAASTLSILLMGLLASVSGLNIPSFSQEENNDGDDTALILSGRINSMLMPTMADTNNDAMNNSMVMPQMMNNSSTASAANDTAASRAMRYSMARDIVWLLSGDWVLASNSNESGSNTTTFDVEFIKVSTNGTMLHTHRITNFVPLTNASDIAAAFNSNTNTTTIVGKADVYFNDELAWSQADTILSIMNGTVLMIDIDSEDIDDHFHDQPIYGTVNMLSKGDGFTITLPTPRTIQEKIEQELAEFGLNATQAQSAIETRATQLERTFEEEAMNVFNNITNSIRDFMVRE